MFDKKAQADALILADEGPGGSTDTDIHGVHWDHHKYILEVRPAGQDPFRVETTTKVAIGSSPSTGDLVKVSYDPKDAGSARAGLLGIKRFAGSPLRSGRVHRPTSRAS